MSEAKVERRHRERAADAVAPGWRNACIWGCEPIRQWVTTASLEYPGVRQAQAVAQALVEAEQSALSSAQREGAWAVAILDAWADSHETDGTVTLLRAMGDGAAWGLTLSRASNRSDPAEIGVNDISYYDEDGNRCWFFEDETADAARIAAARFLYSEDPTLPPPPKPEGSEK